MIRADVVIGHIGDKPVGIASWIVIAWLVWIVFTFIISWING
jgi:hypothetical protein